MSAIFVDTSAWYAFLVENDRHHARAKRIGHTLLDQEDRLVTHSFIVCEMAALLQARLGLDALEQWNRIWLPLVEIIWVDAALYQHAIANALAAGRRQVSIADHLSFALMRQTEITTAFAFDSHFTQFGFKVL